MAAPEMRRLAFIGIVQRLGIPLDVAWAVLDAPGAAWRSTVNGQIAELGELIARAKVAQRFLAHALMCAAEHPARDCRFMTETLDRLVDGTPFDQLAAEHIDLGASPPDP